MLFNYTKLKQQYFFDSVKTKAFRFKMFHLVNLNKIAMCRDLLFYNALLC